MYLPCGLWHLAHLEGNLATASATNMSSTSLLNVVRGIDGVHGHVEGDLYM